MEHMDDRLARAWREHRAHLVNLAFRMLGDIGAAEDAVQEAFSRLLRTEPGTVVDERAWLVTVTGRLCLDDIRSARRRLDASVPAAQLDRAEPAPDPADRVTLDDRVGEALLVVLGRLSPAERVVLILHDVFRLPFAEIAATVGRPASTCRQIASRARQRVAGAEPLPTVGPEPVRRVTDAFVAACARGDLDGLVAVLDPDVDGDARFGPHVPVPARSRGAGVVAGRTLVFLGPGATLVDHPAAGAGTLLAWVDRRLLAVVELTVTDGLITHLHADGRPETVDATLEALAALTRG
jgi:RNA polymerase sigma-70 factor (ECF subfamily)